MAEIIYVSNDKLLDYTSEVKAQNDKIYQKAEDGKGLSTNDYTTAEKDKLAGIAEGATSVTKTSQLTNDSGFITTADIPEGTAASTTTPIMDGTAAVGTELAFARGDHVHPTDTSRQAVITGAATTITDNNLTASMALVSDENGKVAASGVTAAELGYLDGVTSSIQTQLNGKANSAESLSGYGITDAYTKTETDEAISTAVAESTIDAYTKVETDEAISNAVNEVAVDAYTKTETDSAITNALMGYVKEADLTEITSTDIDSIIASAFETA